MVLAHLCHALKLDFSIAHCNFQLRGEASDGDEALVKELAFSMNKYFYVTHFKTMDYVSENKVNVQLAARELRYQWFIEIMGQNKIKTLVTAHHADDALETFLINLSRGTGIKGLRGIPAKTETISRPLLKFSREEILNYADKNKLKWREDSSNAETKYLRNKIRHNVVPKLKELHPTFLNNFMRTQELLGQSATILNNHAMQLRDTIFEIKGATVQIHIEKIKQLTPLKAYLYTLFNDFGFTDWDDMVQLLSAMSGKELRSNTHRLLKDREYLILSKINEHIDGSYSIKESEVDISEPLRGTIVEVDAVGNTGPSILYVDKETLNYPLRLRKWQKGDYFYPFGMQGKKKLSKFFKDEKIDVISKEAQWLLCSGNEIVWVIGRRADERFKVTDSTKSILKFEFHS